MIDSDLYCTIIYRGSTHSWRVTGHEPYGHTVKVCGHGSLRRARREAREWLREHSAEVDFERVTL